MPDRQGQHLQWGAEALWRQLVPLLPGLSVEVLASVDSTNTRLLERARRSSGRHDAPVTTPGALEGIRVGGEPPTPHGRRDGDTQPALLVAETQQHGRGRQGRIWHAGARRSLTFSLALPLQPADWSGLSLAVGVALADALDPPAGDSGPRIGLKWPNDLWLLDAPGAGRKLGGILIETVAVGERRMVVVGIGLNVLPQAPGAELSSGFACLQELHPDIDPPQTLHRVALPLVRTLLAFEREGFAPQAAAYRRRDLLFGQTVRTTRADVPEGVAEGVDEHGALRVRAGAVHALVSGEVSVRPTAAH
ncbi:MAG TPA: biotin--[acetyl-CoA-carboxylase] ligase [Rubrivivax sp.]|nr:biotin--[acetyl-CoA-carboxylase] ligase [Rubrivivax sp.]